MILDSDYDAEQFAGNHTPLLVIGTKMDQLDSHRQTSLQMSQIAEECLADEINLVRLNDHSSCNIDWMVLSQCCIILLICFWLS